MSIFYHSFLKGSKNKNKFGEINISDDNFLSSGGYVIVIQWLVRLYMYVEAIRELQITVVDVVVVVVVVVCVCKCCIVVFVFFIGCNYSCCCCCCCCC